MAVRELNGTTDQLLCAVGAASGMAFGTAAALVKFATVTDYRALAHLHDSTGTFVATPLALNNASQPMMYAAAPSNSGVTVSTGVWYLIVARKATGSATPRFSIFSYTSTTWTHANGDAALGDWTAPGASGTIQFSFQAGTGDVFGGRVAARALWTSLPWSADTTGDAALEAAGLEDSAASWLSSSPAAFWLFNQASVATAVEDLSSTGTADQTSITGTTVVTGDDPPGFDFSLTSGTNANAECATASAAAHDATVTTSDIHKIADRGTQQDLTSGSTTLVDLPAGASIAVGNYLVLRAALDNAGASGAAPTLAVSDPGGHTWTVLGPANADPGAASAGSTLYVAYTRITTALANGDDITLTYNVSVAAKAVVVEEWTNIDAAAPVAVAATTTTGSSGTPSISRTPTQIGQVVYGALSTEGPAGDTYTEDTDTTDGVWSSLTRLSTTSGTAAANQTVAGAYKVVLGVTAQTWNPTITSRDWAQVALVFQPGAATNAAAEVATASGAAQAPTVAVELHADTAETAAAALDATVSAGTQTTANAEAAVATAAALDTSTQVDAHAEVATATAAALFDPAGGSIGLELSADSALAAAATAYDATTGVGPGAEVATAGAAGLDATVSVTGAVNANAELALAAAAAGDVSVGLGAQAEVAAGSAAAEDPTTTVSTNADLAAAAAVALDATVTTSGTGAASAQTATGTAVTETPSIRVDPAAEPAGAAGVSYDATVSSVAGTSVFAPAAEALAAAFDAGLSVAALADLAEALAVAFDAVIGGGPPDIVPVTITGVVSGAVTVTSVRRNQLAAVTS